MSLRFTRISARTGRRRRDSGVVAVELALLLLPVVLMLSMAVEYGRVMLSYNNLVKSVRLGARYLSQFEPHSPDDATLPLGMYKTAKANVTNLIIFGNVAGTGVPVAPGLDTQVAAKTASITVCDAVSTGTGCTGRLSVSNAAGTLNQTIDTVTVTISGYKLPSIFPGFSQLTGFNFNNISATMRQN